MNVSAFRRIILGATSAALITGNIRIGAEEVVELRMRGRYFTEPATVRITIAVAPDEANRMLVVEADGDKLYRSSEVALAGKNAERIHTVEFKNLPAGEYIVRAEVRSDVKVRGAVQQLVVVGDPGDR